MRILQVSQTSQTNCAIMFDGISIFAQSTEIQSQGHKKTASIKFETPTILKCCTNGGRTIVMESKCSLPKDIEPRFLVYKYSNGTWSQDFERQNMVTLFLKSFVENLVSR